MEGISQALTESVTTLQALGDREDIHTPLFQNIHLKISTITRSLTQLHKKIEYSDMGGRQLEEVLFAWIDFQMDWIKEMRIIKAGLMKEFYHLGVEEPTRLLDLAKTFMGKFASFKERREALEELLE